MKNISRWEVRGYVVLQIGKKQIREHRYVMEKHLGRKLEPTEIVHHINDVRNDNRLCNLEIMTKGDHQRHHMGLNPIYKRRGKDHHCYGKRGEGVSFYGKKHSEESRRKMSIKQKGKHVSDETRKRMSIATKKA